MNDMVRKIIVEEYRRAVSKHPKFAFSPAHAVGLITEELGELAQEINNAILDVRDGKRDPLWRDKAIIEAAHVVVTAIRTMDMLAEDEK